MPSRHAAAMLYRYRAMLMPLLLTHAARWFDDALRRYDYRHALIFCREARCRAMPRRLPKRRVVMLRALYARCVYGCALAR